MNRYEIEAEIRRTLDWEAELLDERRFDDWLQMLAPDIVYKAPVRLTREQGEFPELSGGMDHFDDDYETLHFRVNRLKTEFAWAEDPPSRTRHFITNIRVDFNTSTESEFKVKSSFLLYRNRGAEASADLLSGERRDVWRRDGDKLVLAKRVVVFDQATLGVRGISFFI